MSYVCLEAEECRVFIKNGKLRFQARKTNDAGDIIEQVTVSLPKDAAYCFTQVEDLDEMKWECEGSKRLNNRIEDYLTGGN